MTTVDVGPTTSAVMPAKVPEDDALPQHAGTLPGLDLYWIPVGAGRHVVRLSSTIYEALCALVQRRRRGPLFHSALVATTPDGRVVVETTEIRDARGAERGVVAEGAVGTRWLGRFRLFRYEVRRWRGGVIPDLSFAVQSPVRITGDPGTVRDVLGLVPLVPTAVWGRDEMETGDMWNSNSLTAWLLASVGLDAAAGRPPAGGRAPGWEAGLVVARRDGSMVTARTAARQVSALGHLGAMVDGGCRQPGAATLSRSSSSARESKNAVTSTTFPSRRRRCQE